MSTGQWIGQVRSRITGRIVYKSRPADMDTAKRRAESVLARKLGGNAHFELRVVDRYAKEG